MRIEMNTFISIRCTSIDVYISFQSLKYKFVKPRNITPIRLCIHLRFSAAQLFTRTNNTQFSMRIYAMRLNNRRD